ncbi:hypothetical protein [Phytohabitans kaempferiae]|uniref:Flavodoxin-like fold domain-containing protein n=1 Tax=Phytohabitans kaempferiae TaxID=1620943 RepID=A0ABV6MBN5_9ACTN
MLHPAGRAGATATSSAFLDGYGAAFGLTFTEFTFDHDPSLLGDDWADMVHQVLSIAA